MSEKCKIEIKNGITTIKVLKNPTYKELQIIIDELAEKNLYELRLWDLSNIEFSLDMNNIREIAEYGKNKFIRPNKMAMFAPQDLAFGSLRAFEVYREQDICTARVFRTKQEAVEWLENQR